MMNEDTYEKYKVRNLFTAYVLSQIKGRKNKYLEKRKRISAAEDLLDDFSQTGLMTTVEEAVYQNKKEELLIEETKGHYPKWDELSDHRLLEALLSLRDDERKFIYQHVFEEMTFDEMSSDSGLPPYRIKSIYYYAIRKIRAKMGGEF